MRVNDDGSTSFFAISRKGNEAANEKMAEKRAAKKAEAKKANKKAERKRQEDRIEKHRNEKRTKEKEAKEKVEDRFNEKDYEFIEADSVEELMKKVTDREYEYLSNSLRTPEESRLGGSIDFAL